MLDELYYRHQDNKEMCLIFNILFYEYLKCRPNPDIF